MGTINSIDVRIAIFFKRLFNYYIRKRTYVPEPTPPPSQNEIWESLFLNYKSYNHCIYDEITIKLFKESELCKCIYFGFELNEIEFVKKYLKSGDTFIDVGANIGFYTLIASKLVENTGKVIAFEPTPQVFERLQENIFLNNFSNVETYNIGLSNRRSVLPLNISNNGHDAWNSFAKLENIESSEVIEVSVEKLDAFINRTNIRKIDLVKIDVEGWEKYVLEGSENLLKNKDAPVFMIEFTETNAFSAGYYLGEIYDLMKNYGFEWYSYNSSLNSLIPEKKKLHYPYENLIAIKNIYECLNRISS